MSAVQPRPTSPGVGKPGHPAALGKRSIVSSNLTTRTIFQPMGLSKPDAEFVALRGEIDGMVADAFGVPADLLGRGRTWTR